MPEKYETVQLKDLELFSWLIRKDNKLPHEALEVMIEHKQDVSKVKLYLQAMIKHIDKKGLIIDEEV